MTRLTIDRLRSAIHDLAHLAVPCSLCAAGAGERCVSQGPLAARPGEELDYFHSVRSSSAHDAAKAAITELGDQRCPWCGQPVGIPSLGQGWHRCKPSPQLEWLRQEFIRLRSTVVAVVGEDKAKELFAEGEPE